MKECMALIQDILQSLLKNKRNIILMFISPLIILTVMDYVFLNN